MRRVDDTGSSHNGRAVLVVMEHGDVAQFLQALLNDEAIRRADIFKVDTAKRDRNSAHGLDDLIDIL
jgi:hypothetical protein